MSFGSTVYHFEVGKFGSFDYHQWNHPGEGKKNFEEATVSYYERFLKYGPIAIDIGAHSGDTTLPIAAAGFKTTVAFEPNPYAFEILNSNANDNQGLNIIPVCAAVMEMPGHYTFIYGGLCNGGYRPNDPSYHFTHGGEPLTVEGRNLLQTLADLDIPIEEIGFIKIDTEGYDKEILKGLLTIKDRLNAAIQIEVFENLTEQGIQDLERVIRELGYKMYRCEDLSPVVSCKFDGRWPNASTDLILLR